MRSSAQMISYELSLTLSVVGVLMISNSLSLVQIVQSQQEHMARIHSALEHFPAADSVHRLHHRGDCRDKPFAVRHGRIRTGTGQRLAYRIQLA